MGRIYSKVSIIMATYNRSHLISECLDSIKNQTYENWECLIIDDGSEDDTQLIVSDYLKNDHRFQYFVRSSNYQKGLPGCRNFGLDKASGNYIIFFDDDDIVHPENLEICLKILEDPKHDFCHYKKRSFEETIPVFSNLKHDFTTYKIGEHQLENVITNKIALASCTVMWRNTCFKRYRFDESLSYAEEWECYIRLLLNGFYGIGIDQVLYYNRKHLPSNTGEFWIGNKKRRNDYRKAVRLVIDQLIKRSLFSDFLIRHFIQLSVFLKDKKLLEFVVIKSGKNRLFRIQYRLFYNFYPILIIGHRTRKSLNI